MDDLVLRSGDDARQFLRADLDGATLNGASPQGHRAEAAGGGADRLIVAQERRLNGSCQATRMSDSSCLRRSDSSRAESSASIAAI